MSRKAHPGSELCEREELLSELRQFCVCLIDDRFGLICFIAGFLDRIVVWQYVSLIVFQRCGLKVGGLQVAALLRKAVIHFLRIFYFFSKRVGPPLLLRSGLGCSIFVCTRRFLFPGFAFRRRIFVGGLILTFNRRIVSGGTFTKVVLFPQLFEILKRIFLRGCLGFCSRSGRSG